MKDSTSPSQDESATPTERPAWRFSGRRGTPVHLRDQAPQTLPPEIRTAITQLARERAGESAPAPDARPVRPSAAATTGLQFNREDKAAPPVAAAPLPVERRTRRESAEPAVASSPIPAAEAPLAPIELPPVVEAPEAGSIPPVEQVVDAEPAREKTTEVAAAPAPTVEAPAIEAPEVEAPADATPSAAAPATEQRKLSPAERKKRAKARAKARARSQRNSKKGFGETSADGGRRLFARGRQVDAKEAAAIEPAASTAIDPGQTGGMSPASTTTGTDAPVPPTTDEALVPAATIETPASTEHTDVPEVPDVPATKDAPDTKDAPATHDMPEPVLATENGAQAAWELGRLPILLSPPTPEPEATSEPRPTPLIDIPAGPVWETTAETGASVRPTRRREREVTPRSMNPIDWRAIGNDPAPAPIEPADLPRRATPDAIARLATPLEVQENVFSHARAGTRDEGVPATSRALDARRRIARRRAELDDVVHMLAGLGSSRRDS